MRHLATLLFAFAATAQAAQAQELPTRVGRVAHIEGTVSLYQDPETGWEKGYVNSPITSENSVWTEEDARAEVRVSGTALRLDRLTQLDIATLDDEELDAFVARGSVSVRVRHFEKGEKIVLGTPNASVNLRGDGRYRIDVDPDRNETRVTVLAGEARVGTEEGRVRVAAGRSVLIFGVERPEFVEESARQDGFDRWVQARDERWIERASTTYVSSRMTGYEDLDAYGSWEREPDYGVLWYPSRVDANWAPYRYGRWDYVRPWGWTWVDDAPWGYAPFHYGRWVYVRDRWAWHPGERVSRPAWAPALVAWIGGAGISVGVSSTGPSLGWYPLSPWDRYDPWFRASPTYVNRVNVIVRDRGPRDDRRRWHEITRERGATVVDRGAFLAGRPIHQSTVRVSREAIRAARNLEQPATALPSRSDFLQRRRDERPARGPVAQPSARPGMPTGGPNTQSIARPDFARRPQVAAPRPASSAPAGQRPATGGPASEPQPVARPSRENPQREVQQQERAQREAQQQQERARREAQQQQQAQQREQREAQERAAREAQQRPQPIARPSRENPQRDAQQAQERAQREAQQQQERARREAQQQQERARRDAQQQQERARREAQPQQQQPQAVARPSRENPQREAQQREAQQREAQERAKKEAQQQQERAAREAQSQQQQQQQQQQQRPARGGRDRDRD